MPLPLILPLNSRVYALVGFHPFSNFQIAHKFFLYTLGKRFHHRWLSRSNTRQRTIIQYTPVIQADPDSMRALYSIACLTSTTTGSVALLKVMHSEMVGWAPAPAAFNRSTH